MHPSFGPSPRRSLRGMGSSGPSEITAARARTTALAAAGLFGAAAVLAVSAAPRAAHAQNGSNGNINIPRVAPYLPADAPQQLIDQDYYLRYLDAVAKARKQASQNAALVPLGGAQTQTGIGGQPMRNHPVVQGGLNPSVGQVKALNDALAQRSAMPSVRVNNGGTSAGAASTSGGSKNLSAVTRTNIGNTQGLWAFLGPQNMTEPTQQFLGDQAVIGRINGIGFDPTSNKTDVFGNVSPEIFYVATSNGGVWRYNPTADHRVPTDPGVLTYGPWEVLSDFSFPTLSTSCVTVDPTNPRIIYVGTGDYPAQQGTGYGNGIMRSVDGGKTWLNVGQNLSGAAVSAIIVSPEFPKEIVATTGRGIASGFIWQSTDGGNTWVNVSPLDAQGNAISGNWSSVDYGAALPTTAATLQNPNHNRVYYASCENVGVYRSFDRGATWQRIDQNVRAGGGLVYNTKVDPATTRFGLQVSASKLPYQSRFPAQTNTQAPTIAQGPSIVYIIDSANNYNDGKIFKSLDNGDTWTDITGTFPTNVTNTANGVIDNNWFVSDYALRLKAATLPLSDFTVNPDPLTGLPPTRTQEGLYGSGRTFSGTRGGITLDGANFLYSFDITTQTISPTQFDLGVSGLWTDISQSLGFNGAFSSLTPVAHRDFHDTAVSPNNDTRIIVANDGGVNRFIYTPGFATSIPPAPAFVYLGGSAWTLDGENLNAQLGIGLVEKGDFIQTSPTHYRATGNISNNTVFTGDLDFTSVTPPSLAATPFWSFAPYYPNGSTNVLVPDTPVGTNTNGVPATNSPPLVFNIYGNSIIFDKNDTTGQTLYTATDYRGNWPFLRLYYTRDNFGSYQDITPDRYLSNNFGTTPARDANGRQPLYIYNTIDPSDSTTPANWQGEIKPSFKIPGGIRMVTGLAGSIPHRVFVSPATVPLPNTSSLGSVLYLGAQYLWRFDPPVLSASDVSTVPRLPGVTSPGTGPNPDFGIWRRVGGTQLATGTDFITAIAVNKNSQTGEGDVIYVGTNEGKLWVMQNATRHSQAPPLPALNSAWKQLGGLGSNNLTLPNAVAPTPPALPRPITSISINSDAQSATFGDVLVGYGNSANAKGGGLFRGANTLGPQNGAQPVFTGQGGQGFAALPGAAINEIVRDPDDPTNTIFVATDLGVFATTNGGATWSNATAPLGLPNVQCTSLKIVGTSNANDTRFLMVSTYGRGMFRFDLNNLKLAAQPTNLTFDQTITRSGNLIIVNLTIANSGATAQNVRLNRATLTVGTSAPVDSTSIPQQLRVVPAPPTLVPNPPLTVGTVGAGQSITVALRFDATKLGRAGTAVVFNVNGDYTVAPFPPGTLVTFDNKPGVRTRLP